jgi:hypothetical protein
LFCNGNPIFFFPFVAGVLLGLCFVHWVLSSETLVGVERIGVGSSHVVSVSHPDIVTLLATEDTNHSKNHNGNDDDCCQNTSGDTNNSRSADTEQASLSVTIANTAIVDSRARNLLQIATSSGTSGVGIGTEGNVAVGDVRSDQSVLAAIVDGISASLDGIALVAGAWISVVASDVGVDATGLIVASVSGASVVVIAVQRNIEGNVDATASWVAIIVSASVVVVASHSSVCASGGGSVASVDGAQVVVIAVDGSGNAVSSAWIAIHNLARLRRASHCIAEASGHQLVLAGAGGIARVQSASVSVVAVLLNVLARGSADARVVCARIVVVADHWIVDATVGTAGIGGASVSVAASDVGVLATVTGCSSDALIAGARIVVVALWTDASLTARAESQTSSSALRARNINARGNNEGIQDTTQLREVSGEESGLDTREGRGDVLNLASDGIGDTDGEEDHTISFAVGHNACKGACLLIVSSISQQNEDLVHSGSGIRTRSSDGLVSSLNTATNASVSSSLGDTVHGIEERLLIRNQSDDQSSGSGEHHKTHLNVLRSKLIVSGNISTESLLIGERGSIDRSGFIEDEHEVDLLGAFRRRASPRQGLNESLAGNGSDVANEVEMLAVDEDGSAGNSRTVHVDGGDSRGPRSLHVSVAGASATHSDAGGIGRSVVVALSEEDGHGNIVGCGIASSAATQVSESLTEVNEFFGLRSGANGVVNSHLLGDVIVGDSARQISINGRIVINDEVCSKLIESLSTNEGEKGQQ